MDVNPLFNRTIKVKEKVIVSQGSSSSGKTFAILQCIFYWSITKKRIVTTIVAEDIPNLKRGAIRDAFTIIHNSPEIKQQITDYNKTDRIITFANGSVVEFNSYDDEQDAKSGKRDILFVNEADSIPYEIYWQLSIRTRFKIIVDYNPSSAFWAHEKLIGTPGVKLIISDHRKNRFLSQAQHDEIEGIKDPDRWLVYARGKTGVLRHSVFPNWKIIPPDQFPTDYSEVIWGIDYGYGAKATSGKTAIIKVGFVKPDKLYLREVCYETGGLDEYQIKKIMEAHGWVNGQPFYSERDPDKIGSLRKLGMYVLEARKGTRSEWHGIKMIDRFQVYYTSEDANLHEERQKIKWVKVGNIITDTVEDTNNYHQIAAGRYAIYTHFYRRI